MSDFIDRQVAIDEIMGQPPEPHYPSWYAEQINNLPSAQHASVESIANDIYNTDATDTIKRSDALKVCKGYNGSGYTWASIADEIRHLPSAQPEILKDGTLVIDLTLKQLDKVNRVLLKSERWCNWMYMDAEQSERKKGKWIKDKKSLWSLGTCSVCGVISVEADTANFCPKCGAKMERSDNG